MRLRLSLLPDRLGIARLAPGPTPAWVPSGRGFQSITRSAAELSIVCDEDVVPGAVTCDRGWRCLEVAGPLDLALVGVVAELAGVLGAAGISVFIVSTYDTDYVLVRGERLDEACEALRRAGHEVGP